MPRFWEPLVSAEGMDVLEMPGSQCGAAEVRALHAASREAGSLGALAERVFFRYTQVRIAPECPFWCVFLSLSLSLSLSLHRRRAPSRIIRFQTALRQTLTLRKHVE